jgi:hypothetical protein
MEGQDMSIRIPLPVVIALFLLAFLIPPAFGQFTTDIGDRETSMERRDRAAIQDLLNYYEQAFNTRDINWRMSLCLDTYEEYGFENGAFQQVRDYSQTQREIGSYWASINSLEYSIDEVEITLDGPQAFVRAYTTHLAPNDHHSSIVYFSLVKINGMWRIAWDSYNIVRRYTE